MRMKLLVWFMRNDQHAPSLTVDRPDRHWGLPAEARAA